MLMTSISDRLAGVDGLFGVSYINLTTEEEFFCGNNQVFRGSGAIMLMALVECFRQMEAGELDKDRICKLSKAAFRCEKDSSYGVLKYLHAGIEVTVSDLYNLMASISDNMAFNTLLDVLGIEKINETFRALGYTHMQISRKINDEEKMAQGVENYISVPEMATIFHRLEKGQLISPAASAEMLRLMKQHQRTSMIPYIFSEAVRVAHVSGFDDDEIIDGGIVYTDAPFILVMAADRMDARRAQVIMRDITQLCHEEG